MNLYRSLATPEPNGKTIGLFRILTAIFGGLVLSYVMMCSMVFLYPSFKSDLAVIALLYNTLAWSVVALWIALAPTRLSALLRFVVPTILFSSFLGYVYG
ncbi:hypothetical protein [Sulfurospirillum barnesii]|uniref:DUF3649 domain-containing protein n=1 Tax=Sulfurospirillum barnesii (strain ATCC 700032 / DSM 10660 / SES-3) TaxID=760154 RepID=I3XXZ4_SULBS|nr:hypothetical protein [Sulfurospirillum barnesii]AFL68818.1 hypothetical protein Sulba_1530 [Sulfurospirillum barnesii SES-3]